MYIDNYCIVKFVCLLYNGTVYVTFIIFKHGKDYPKRDDKNHPTVYDNVITFG